MDVEDVPLIMLPCFARLASNRGSTKSRQSASELLPDIYFAVGDSNVYAKITIQNTAATLSKDCMNSIVESVSQSLSVSIQYSQIIRNKFRLKNFPFFLSLVALFFPFSAHSSMWSF